MAATKINALQALSAAALSLPGMVSEARAGLPAENTQMDFQYGYYQESDDRISVDIYQGRGVLPVSENAEVLANWTIDTFSGATPVLTMPESVAQSMTGASGISDVDNSVTVDNNEKSIQVMTGASTQETRYGIDLGLRYFFDDIELTASGGRSEEPDYLSHAYHVGMNWEFNGKLSSISLGFGQNFDEVEPTTRSLREEKTDHHFELGFSQILTKKTLLLASLNYTYSEGYLSNPYKKVFIQGVPESTDLQRSGFDNIFFENRPDKRDQWAVTLGYIHYFPERDSALHIDYRYFTDSWDIDSHTFEMVIYQPLGNGWMLAPRIRYYSQSEAQFHQDFYTEPRLDNHYSSDYRLAGFGNISGGLKLSKEWARIGLLTESFQFEVGIEYTEHAAGLKLGEKTGPDLTDFSYFLVTGALKIRF